MPRELPTIVLGRTGLEVTRLGIGGAYCDTPEGYRRALDCGVNYVDTARVYRDGDDERVIGEAIAGRRQQLVVCTKTEERLAAGARKDLETSLKLLGTDYVDIWHIHHLNDQGESDRALGPGGAIEAAIRAREEGLVRFIGVTGHNWRQVARNVDTGLFDSVLCWYNCAYKEPESSVFPAATAHGAGVVIMNATRNDRLFGGTDAPPGPDYYRYVLSHEAVHVTIMGLRNLDLFCQVAAALGDDDAITPQMHCRLERYGAGLRSAGKLVM